MICKHIATLYSCTALQNKFKKWKIYYYAAVNAYTGALYMKMMTGTVGKGVGKTEYTVRKQTTNANMYMCHSIISKSLYECVYRLNLHAGLPTATCTACLMYMPQLQASK